MTDLERRAAVHAALADPTRLRIVDLLALGDASSSELAAATGVSSNLLAHHLKVLDAVGLLERRPSEGDGRRAYLRLHSQALAGLGRRTATAPERVVFVCTANSARSQLAEAMWRRISPIAVASAGIHPADAIEPGALRAAERHGLALKERKPRHLDDIERPGDLVITVCDLAHEDLARPLSKRADLHWSVPDPVRTGTVKAFDIAYDELAKRIGDLAPRLQPAS